MRGNSFHREVSVEQHISKICADKDKRQADKNVAPVCPTGETPLAVIVSA
jgi:hypothetical protein